MAQIVLYIIFVLHKKKTIKILVTILKSVESCQSVFYIFMIDYFLLGKYWAVVAQEVA